MARMAAAVLVALLALPTPVGAGTNSRSDPNDVRGPLDIKRITHGYRGGNVLWHRVVMHRRWGPRHLQGQNEIRFHFSNDGEDRFDEVHASVAVHRGKLRAWIFPYTEGSDYAAVGPSERIRFTRPTRRSIKIFFEESWMRNRRDRYAWSVGTAYRESSRCRRNCYDYAPGHDPERLEHRI